ncbi:conserved hypothetical protein (plasmid) [Thioalkalivibrio sp. K90mix]|uniref:hypothetical protein n=1 Tax=Thioalkalivibrio sp. (strain K90mix) TaxID=396595 RepID=UPI000195AB95|nr:hypothetical protein [Thioalkalivibrio sp. K90mix]ADC73120.1 conserved hypothetical protein [Thioalkalivibrio sp. K90mix]
MSDYMTVHANEGRTTNRFTVHELPDGCIGVEGPNGVSMRLLNALMRGLSEEEENLHLSMDLAARTGWTFFIGPPDALAARTRALDEDAKASAPGPDAPVMERLRHWGAHGEPGLSANTLAGALKADLNGADLPEAIHYPHDPSDLRRCRLLIDQVPEAAPESLRLLRAASPQWDALARGWGALCARMDHECPQWRAPEGETFALRTYRHLQAVIEGAD